MLHANFVVAVLSDLFGIQARSGCFCAGPYLHRLYAIDEGWSTRMEAEVAKGNAGAKLAFTRISFNYFISEAAFDVHRRRGAPDRRRRLEAPAALPLRSGHRPVAPPRPQRPRRCQASATCWHGGRPPRFATAPESVLPGQLAGSAADHRRGPGAPARAARSTIPSLSDEFERIRWFPLPGEGLAQRLRAAAAVMNEAEDHGT